MSIESQLITYNFLFAYTFSMLRKKITQPYVKKFDELLVKIVKKIICDLGEVTKSL